jgi:hypothetical protein
VINCGVLPVVIVLVLSLGSVVVIIDLSLFVSLNSLSKEMIRVFPIIRVRVSVFRDLLEDALFVYLFVE